MLDVRGAATVEFRLNGEPAECAPDPCERLSETLRERLACRDVKVGCDAGDCGACTVLLDGAPVCACLTPSLQVAGKQVETLSGLVDSDRSANALTEAFQRHGAAQCGICTPGMVVSAVALLRSNPTPDEPEVKDALGGVLCRCTGYRKIIDAVLDIDGNCSGDGSLASDGVGASIRKVDGAAKVEGREIFGDDAGQPDWSGLLIVRSPYPHAAFRIGCLEEFVRENDGIDAVLTARDIPGLNRMGVIPGFIDQPVFAESRARFRGEAVAALVGRRDVLQRFDLRRFPIEWEELPTVSGIGAALDDDAAPVHADRPSNVMCSGVVRRGDVDAALRDASIVVEGLYSTPFVEHAYIEPEAGCGFVKDGRIEVHAGTQAPVMDRDGLASILAMDQDKVRIVPTAAGGGFGSKLDLSVQPYLALAALRTGNPVRIAYTRTESMQATTKRHPAEIRMRVGATGDGRICGVEYEGRFNTGAYASWGPTVVNRVPVHASGPYRVENYRASTWGVHTHNPPSGAFRGFGVPQSAIAQETLFDELADGLGIDPLEFRIRNALVNGDPTVCGQVFSQGVGIKECLEALRPHWSSANRTSDRFNRRARDCGSPERMGVGIASGWYGCGNTSLPNPSTIKAGVRRDGTVVLHQGAVDIGQGSNTVVAQIFAEALGVPTSGLVLASADTDMTPDGGKTSASRQTYVSGNAARLSGESLRRSILRMCNASEDASLEIGEGSIRVADRAGAHVIRLDGMDPDQDGYVLSACETYDPPTTPLDENGQGEPYAQFGYAAQMAILVVDTSLGTVRVEQFVAAHDVGRAINPLLVEGQVHGGIAQGLGMALMEEYVPGRTENLHDYLIPTFGDVPPVSTIIIEEADAHGPYGAKGLGEHALIPTAPAILNAIRRACGARLRSVPATPSRVLAAIGGGNAG